MKEGIKLELYRAFHNVWYIVAVGAGCLIAAAHFIMFVLPKTQYIGANTNMEYPQSVYNSCLMVGMDGFYGYLFYYGIILLGTLPYGISYFTDKKEGYIKNIYSRMNRKYYLTGKYLAVFLSAASVCLIPLIFNFYLTALVLPAVIPQAGTGMFILQSQCMFSGIFYTHPFLYICIYLLIDGAMTGLFACLTLLLSDIANNRYLILFVPFLCFLVSQTVCGFCRLDAWGPYFVMNPTQMAWENALTVFSEIGGLFLLTAGGFALIGGVNKDAL